MFGDAEAYERFMGRWSRLLRSRLVKFAGVRDAGRVLETGSGKNRCQVLGIDPSSEYVEFAKSRNPVPDRVNFEAGDARQPSRMTGIHSCSGKGRQGPTFGTPIAAAKKRYARR